MSKSQEPPRSRPESCTRKACVEYRLADDGGKRFRTIIDVLSGRHREPQRMAIEGHIRKVTPELEKELAEMLAQMLVAEYRRREAAGRLDQPPPLETPMPDSQADYLAGLTERLWAYRYLRFAGRDGLFDLKYAAPPKPPVFAEDQDNWNVIVPNDPTKASEVRAQIRTNKRHRWFRSMKSSQALTLSVFGNLKLLGHTDVLTAITSDGGGGPAFGPGPIGPDDILLEYEARLPGERNQHEHRCSGWRRHDGVRGVQAL